MSATRRSFLQLLSVSGAAAALAGCDQAADALAAWTQKHPQAKLDPPAGRDIDLAQHLLNRLTFGPRPGDYQRVLAMGSDAFLAEQLAPEKIDDSPSDLRVMQFETLVEPAAEMYEYEPRHILADMTRHKLVRAVHSRRQLFEVMVDFWTDHFNIASEKGDCRWVKAADDRDVIRRHAMGSFRDLLRASALSPAMLIYLDGKDNKVARPADKPNENYARELLELHTLGVHGGYTQRDIQEVARCLSGWTYRNRPARFEAAKVTFEPRWHDDGEKVVLGQVITRGGGAADLERVLDIVSAHPSTAKYLATKLCRRFIADAPPESAIDTVAHAFAASGGDIRTTLAALFATDDFRTDSGARGCLFKRPLRFIVSALRATDARTDCGKPIIEALSRMGHAPFQYPTPDGYPMEAEPWLGTLLWRWQWALALDRQQINGTRIDPRKLTEQLGGRDALAAHLLGRAPSDAERTALAETDHAIALLLAGPAFQRF